MAFRLQHLEQLPPTREAGLEFLGVGVGDGTQGGTHDVGTAREDVRIEAIRLRELAGRFRTVTHVARIHHDDRIRRGRQRGDHEQLVPAGGFEHDPLQRQRS